MLSSQESGELALLRERVFGPAAAPVPPEVVRRLSELEQKNVSGATNDDESASPEPFAEPADGERSAPMPDDPSPPARPHRRLLGLPLVGALAAFALGAAACGSILSLTAEPGIPELEWEQTAEDRIFSVPEGQDPDAGLEPASIRFVANVDNTILYLGYQAGTRNVCLAAITPVEPTPVLSCGSTAVSARIADDFFVSVGPVDAAFREQIGRDLPAHRLTESVTAFYAADPVL